MSQPSAVLAPVASEGPTAQVEATPATIVALIAHARGVPSIAREAFAAECDKLQGNDAVVIVHTCHRVELYVALESFGDGELPSCRREGCDSKTPPPHATSSASPVASRAQSWARTRFSTRSAPPLRHAAPHSRLTRYSAVSSRSR